MSDITGDLGSIDDDVKLLNDEPSSEGGSEESPNDDEDSEPAPSETDDEEEPESEEEEPSEEEDEDKEDPEPVEGRVSPKELKAKYPDIFKEFPDLRRAIAHENEYSKIYPTVESAKESQQVVSAFNELGEACMGGDPGFLLEKIGKQDKEAYQTYVDNFLPAVFQQNPVIFAKVTKPIINNILRHAKETGERTGDKNLRLAAAYISKHLHGDPNIPDDGKREEDPRHTQKEKDLAERERSINARLHDNFVRTLEDDGDRRVYGLIRKDMDPENAMSPKVREAAVKECYEQINSLLGKDSRHTNNMRALLRQAETEGFSQAAKDKIISALLARVKPLLPSIRQKVRQDYLGQRRTPDKNRKADKKFIPSSSSTGRDRSGGNLDPKKLDLRNVTDEQILDDNYKPTFKK